MPSDPKTDPMHGVTLEMLLTRLVEHYGWEALGDEVPINCFVNNPTLKSSLTFLRRTPWARKKVEDLYLDLVWQQKKSKPSEST
jgi:uncharacterized protein (DUF2132 family)